MFKKIRDRLYLYILEKMVELTYKYVNNRFKYKSEVFRYKKFLNFVKNLSIMSYELFDNKFFRRYYLFKYLAEKYRNRFSCRECETIDLYDFFWHNYHHNKKEK